MDISRIVYITGILLLSLIIQGCSIEESTKPATGDISVSTADIDGDEIIGGRIFLDGADRCETTPATLTDVAVGTHHIRVKALGYNAGELDVEVTDDEVAQARFTLVQADFGFLSVVSDPPGADIIIDEVQSGYQTPYLFGNLDAGMHSVSVFLDGYWTEAPALISDEVPPEDTLFAEFNLNEGVAGVALGNIPPDFSLTDDYGNTVNLREYRGHVIHLTFFFKDCRPCMDEFPSIEEAAREYADRGVQVIGIDPMYRDDLDDIQSVRENLGLTFRLVLDVGSVTTGSYSVIYFPTNIIIDQTGRIAYLKIGGGLTYEILSEEYERILGCQD